METKDKILSNQDLTICLTKSDITVIEELKCVGQNPVKCYTIDNRSNKTEDVYLDKYTYWRYLTRLDKEYSGNYMVMTVNPENILYDNMYNPNRKDSYTDLIIKPRRYSVTQHSHNHWSGNDI